MRYVAPSSPHDMVAAFLRAELSSPRFGGKVSAALLRMGQNIRIIEQPNIHDPGENYARDRVLGAARGYRMNRELFSGFPDDVLWHRVQLSAVELAAVRYIRHPYWQRLSNATRSPAFVVSEIHASAPALPDHTKIRDLAQRLNEGLQVPELILVGTTLDSPLVVLEGHIRLTAYLVAPQALTRGLEVIVGCSDAMPQWACY